MARRTRAERQDGIINLVTGLGISSKDKKVHNVFGDPYFVTPGELESAYRGDGISRRIIDLVAQEMTREWFEVDGDADGLALGYLESLHAKAAICEALKWGDLYGGAMIVLGLDDGQEDLSMPLNEAALKGISFFRVYERRQIVWTSADLETNPAKPLYNQPTVYTVFPFGVGASVVPDGTGRVSDLSSAFPQYRVHESRTLKFIGAKVPPRAERENMGWGDSLLQAIYPQLQNVLGVESNAVSLIEEWAIGKLTIKNLVQLLAAKDGETKVKNRLDVIDYGKHVLKSMLLAEGETFERTSQSVGGLPELIDRERQSLCAAAAIPMAVLYEHTPGGLAATGAINQDVWYDEIRARQELKLLPQLERLVRYVYLSKQGPTQGKEPKNWKINFKPPKQMTEQEEAALRFQMAEADQMYVNSGVLTPEEVAISRFGGERYSIETEIDESIHQIPTTEELAMQEAAARQVAKAGGNGKMPPSQDNPRP